LLAGCGVLEIFSLVFLLSVDEIFHECIELFFMH
jgi:hypothetical protein